MPISVIFGGQFGSEGKGKVAHFWTAENGASVAVRVGGPNSGHTVVNQSGDSLILRQLPTAAILPGVRCVLPAGSYLQVKLLLDEIERTGIDARNVLIDPNAFVLSDSDAAEEQIQELRKRIGSTQTGTGAAVLRRISRQNSQSLAKDCAALSRFIIPTVPLMRESLRLHERIIIEGTQGFGLSLLHSPFYPYVTSRDTGAASFVSEAGLSPLDVDQIVMVIRTFPIRVPGSSGPLPNETDWKVVTEHAGSSQPLTELTSVTRLPRRVAFFDFDVVDHSISSNQPTHIVLNHMDYLENGGTALVGRKEEFLTLLENRLGRRVDFLGFGPATTLENTSSSWAPKSDPRHTEIEVTH